MKKKISIILVLVMVLSMFSAFAFADTTEAAVALDDPAVHNFVNKMRGNIDKLKLKDLLTLKSAANKLKDKNAIVSDILSLIRASEFDSKLKEFGINNDSEEVLLNQARNIKSQINIEYLITNALEGANFDNNRKIADLKVGSSGSAKTVGELANETANILLRDTGINNVYNALDPVDGKSKAKISIAIANLIIDNTTMSMNSPYTITLNKSKILNGINDILKESFNVNTEFELKDINALEVLIKDIMKEFTPSEKLVIARAVTAIKGENPYPNPGGDNGEEPGNGGGDNGEGPGSGSGDNGEGPGSGSGGGGGGGGGSTSPQPEDTKVDSPKVKDGEIVVELGKDSVEVKTGAEGQSVVAIKSESIKAAVEILAEAGKKSQTAKLVVAIKLDDVKTADMEVSISADAMTKLVENKVELRIESEALTYIVPANALANALKDAPKGSYVEFVLSVVEEGKAKDLIKDNFAKKIAKTLEMQLVIKDNTGKIIKTINNFDNKIKISIAIEAKDGNPDLLGVFYINEKTGALEFVGGKIKDNKISMSTDHYGKFAVVEYDKSFSDIENHWSKDYVKSMVAKHVIDGFVEENLYKPEDKLTRAQFAKLIVETLELDMVTSKGEFTDVKSSHWAKDYIATVKALNIVGGYDNGTFKPDQSITRAEMAVVLTNSLELKTNANTSSLNQFKDVDKVPAWAVEYIVPVAQEKLLVGSDGVLNPLGNVTRAEAATIIYRVYNR
ncbi:S-layer homology domain-containing protein [Alkaliphilus sp. B6464]|uniref:S-layer homology domain-containing protein n=1 Tax=Alkaliphilus sp. B6464 TaxID=2731219 RepID=UPI001BA753B4|nr:S-layer homology domain-containing protein [Alkaliphilus sp. B6464]QUH19073.1 S-layer homology domain-containing protein [Alkaliphilus sp. B6464]